MKIVTILWMLAMVCLLFYAYQGLPVKLKIIFIILSVVLFYPVAHFIRTFLPRYASKKLHKRLGINEDEFYQNPRRYFSLRKEAKLLKALNRKNITSINVLQGGGTIGELKTEKAIEGFRAFLPGNMTFSVRDEVADHFELHINSNGRTYSYDAYALSNSVDDIILKFPECDDYGGICLPGLKRWLDENVFQE